MNSPTLSSPTQVRIYPDARCNLHFRSPPTRTSQEGSIITAIVGLPAVGYLLSPALQRSKGHSDEWVPLGSVDDIPLDDPILFTFTRAKQIGWEQSANSYGIYVVKKADGQLQTFSNICTHLSCRVSWQEDQGQFICPCHDGRFGKDGSIISGPQPRPLDLFEHKIEDGTLMIRIQEG
jgi:menaquinol-cytochrome c reductase iron-sulfur subunit